MSSITFEYNASMLGSIARVVTGGFEKMSHVFQDYLSRRAAERRLVALDDRLLEDIGINRGDIHDLVWNGKAR